MYVHIGEYLPMCVSVCISGYVRGSVHAWVCALVHGCVEGRGEAPHNPRGVGWFLSLLFMLSLE